MKISFYKSQKKGFLIMDFKHPNRMANYILALGGGEISAAYKNVSVVHRGIAANVKTPNKDPPTCLRSDCFGIQRMLHTTYVAWCVFSA